MRQRHPHRHITNSLAVCLLVAGMVFQMGTCPCGCLEHNAWVQLAGLRHDDIETLAIQGADAPVVSEGGLCVAVTDNHECDGQPALDYLNTARSVDVPRDGRATTHCSVCVIDRDSPSSGSVSLAGGWQLANVCGGHAARIQPALQVFRL